MSTWGGVLESKPKHKIINYCVKIIFAGILAFTILNIGCLFYSNYPIHDEEYEAINKIEKYEPIENYTKGVEGYGSGRINNDGYVNTYDYYSNMPINILMMGSSQIEGMQVNIRDTSSYLLNERVEGNVYNIGMSGKPFLISVSNLETAIEKYKPSDYIIIEASNTNFNDKELNLAIGDGIYSGIDLQSDGIMEKIRKSKFFRNMYKYSPFIKLLFQQDKDFKANNNDESIQSTKLSFNKELTAQLLVKVKNIVSTSKADLIIMYHPSITLDSDGSLILSSEQENVKEFGDLCRKNGIYFLDMSERFKEEYENNYILPYGFSNTSVGKGHFNKYGNEMVADELYKLIEEVE